MDDTTYKPKGDGAPRDRQGLPGWVKATGIVVAIIIVIGVAMMIVGGGHNPMRHGMSEPSPLGTIGTSGTAAGTAAA